MYQIDGLWLVKRVRKQDTGCRRSMLDGKASHTRTCRSDPREEKVAGGALNKKCISRDTNEGTSRSWKAEHKGSGQLQDAAGKDTEVKEMEYENN
jgi:hypothetical protein